MELDLREEIHRQHLRMREVLEFMSSMLNGDTQTFFLLINLLGDFVVRLHSRLEDEVMFPMLLSWEDACGQGVHAWEGERKLIPRLKADHKLIETLGNAIGLRGKEFEPSILSKRFRQYSKIILEHNQNEEVMVERISKKCGEVPQKLMAVAAGRTKQIVDEFGRDKYEEFMRMQLL